jgi:hypothetical protein
MASSTTRLLLRKPDGDPVTGDNIDVDLDISASMDKIDDAVGAHVCTSGTRPTGSQRWNGRIIKETDTLRMYVWDAGLSFWLPLLNGRGSGIGPYLLGTSTDTTGEGINSSGTAASTAMWRSRVGSEANPRFTMNVDGELNWGAGGASAVDTRLYRSAADTLRTPDSFTVDANLTVTGTAAWNKLATNSPTGANFSFSGIPATYSHLMIIGSARGSTAATNVLVQMTFNGVVTATYDSQQVSVNGATVAGAEHMAQNALYVGEMAGSTAPAGACGTFTIFIPNYPGTTLWKQFTCSHGLSTGTATTTLYSKHWSGRARATAAIASITFTPLAGNFATGSKFDLYGMI